MSEYSFNNNYAMRISPIPDDYNYSDQTPPLKEAQNPIVTFPKYTPMKNIQSHNTFVPYYPYSQSETCASFFAKTWVTNTETITNTNETVSYSHSQRQRQDAPLAPSNFIGIFKKHKIQNQFEYTLEASWRPSRSSGIILYRIFENGKLVEEISAGTPLVYTKNVGAKDSIQKYTIVAVNKNNIESMPIKLRIIPI